MTRLVDKLRSSVAQFNQAKEDLAADTAAEVQRQRTERVQKLLGLAKQQYISLVSKAAEEGKSLCTLTTFSVFDLKTVLSLLSDLATTLESDGLQLLITDLFEVQRYSRGVTTPVGRVYKNWGGPPFILFQDDSRHEIEQQDTALVAKW
jgi:hypothetical protein